MNYLHTAISHHRSVFCILLLILVAGIFARTHTAIESNPEVTVPIILVQVYLDGVSPEDSARLLVRPLEKELRNLDGVEELTATAYESNAVVVIEFDAEGDINQALLDVREAVDRAKAELPQDAEEPVIEEMSTDDFAAIVVTLSGETISERLLFNAAQKFKRELESLPGVLTADMVGHREEVVEAIINPALLEHYQITSADMGNAVLNNNLLVPAGELISNTGRFSIKVPGLIENHQDVYNLPLKSTIDGIVTLGDIADIRRTFKDPKSFTSINGKPAITVEIKKRLGASSIEISETVRAKVKTLLPLIPQEIEVGYVLDQSDYTRKMVNEMQGNILTAMALVMIIVVAALGKRSGILVGLGIPFSLLFSTIITYYLGFTFNFMVMFGMLLALGMLIDGAIVITEFADRKMAEGASSKEAYIISVERMFWPVIASTATTLAAFLPVMFWPGVVGEFMGYLPTTVFAVLVGSLFYALLFAPVVGAYFGKNNMSDSVRSYLQHLENDPPTSLGGITGSYARLLSWLVQRPLMVIITTLFILLTIFNVYGKHNAGIQFIGNSETVYGSATVRAQGNLSAIEIRDIVREVEQRILEIDGVKTLYTSSDSGGNGDAKDQIGSIWIELNDPSTLGRSTHTVYAEVREHTADMPGIIVNAKGFEDGPPIGQPIQIQLEGINREQLRSTARFIFQHLTTIEGVRDVTDTTPLPGIEWQMDVNRALAAQLGVNVLEVGRAVQLVTNGVKVGEYRPDDADEEIDIRVRYPASNRGINVLDDLRINTNSGVIPISDFVTRTAKPKVDSVKRVNGVEVITVKADVELGVLADDKFKEIKQWVSQQTIDPSVKVVFRGASEEQNKSLNFLSVAFSLALFLMFVLLVTQFNSFYQGILILTAVVMSTAGVLLGLLITQSTFSIILTGIGIVALAGIVVNNNIILIDTYNYLRKEDGLAPIDAVISAGAQRLRPVFLTTATTVMGMLPLALNSSVDLISRSIIVGGEISSFWAPLASAIVYGLLFSTILTLIVTPVLLILPQYLKQLIKQYRPTTKLN